MNCSRMHETITIYKTNAPGLHNTQILINIKNNLNAPFLIPHTSPKGPPCTAIKSDQTAHSTNWQKDLATTQASIVQEKTRLLGTINNWQENWDNFHPRLFKTKIMC